MRFVTLEEFRVAAESLSRYSECSEPNPDEQERYYDKCLRVNAKFVVALYLEQIRLIHLLQFDELGEMRLE